MVMGTRRPLTLSGLSRGVRRSFNTFLIRKIRGPTGILNTFRMGTLPSITQPASQVFIARIIRCIKRLSKDFFQINAGVHFLNQTGKYHL